MVKSITSVAEFDKIASNSLVMVKFSAVWCGPCKAVAPLIDKLEPSFPSVKFTDVDVDEFQEVASRFGVTAMPTFVFLHNGSETARVKGGDMAAITANLRNLAGKQSFGTGQRLGGSTSNVPSKSDIRELRQRQLPQRLNKDNDQVGTEGQNTKAAAKSIKTQKLSSRASSAWINPTKQLFTNLGTYIKLYFWTLFTFDARLSAQQVLGQS